MQKCARKKAVLTEKTSFRVLLTKRHNQFFSLSYSPGRTRPTKPSQREPGESGYFGLWSGLSLSPAIERDDFRGHHPDLARTIVPSLTNQTNSAASVEWTVLECINNYTIATATQIYTNHDQTCLSLFRF